MPATATKTTKGFKVSCIHCGQQAISLKLDNVTEFECGECSETFTVKDVQEHMAQWLKVITWVESVPEME